MIYEFKDTIVHLYKCFIHFFRALFCKDYFTESHGLGMCGQYGRIDAKGKYRFCEYRWCPKRKSNADNAFQHVESVEPTWTKEKHEAFYTFLWNVINPNEMQDYIGMFEPKDEPQTERSSE